MKIGQPLDNPIPVNSTVQASTSKAGQSAASAANSAAAKSTQAAGVEVTVSHLARSLSTAKASDSADVDMAKVNAVKAAIQNGTYTVNPEAIASKLLSNAQEMLGNNVS